LKITKTKKKKSECELVNPSFTIKPGICFTEVTVSCWLWWSCMC